MQGLAKPKAVDSRINSDAYQLPHTHHRTDCALTCPRNIHTQYSNARETGGQRGYCTLFWCGWPHNGGNINIAQPEHGCWLNHASEEHLDARTKCGAHSTSGRRNCMLLVRDVEGKELCRLQHPPTHSTQPTHSRAIVLASN